ncbi:maleylpyruvate isomerase family mycothiol-dependent enzyme [Nocardia cyriacigeorgica]|uniref:Maleylpyruvate isomerase family mycothiol-dependent enzyme n=1 Tax=Nocardia cyriacigeorgica TaxID=135487 RepID=A0A5R8NZB2_9NOCA|nr:maleylpyruvate isomerase family mycothiol-dependent enzyme [Nocardia cyriacigeorgica]TLF82242.1 maleylpyruvate isomerase family mycothiol-dependent enzyme [Nocardia cyriacigeorgica]
MTDTPNQAELTALLPEQWDAIATLVDGLDEHVWRGPSPLPGWTIFDVVAHVVGTESFLLGEKPPARDRSQPEIDVHSLPHVRNETAVFNEIWIQRLRPLTGSALLQRFRDVTERRRKALAAMDETQWQAQTQSPIGPVSYGRFMRVRLFDCWMHELDIADALGVRVDEGGPRGELAFQEFAQTVPRVIAKVGKAPEGSRIAFELTGPLARTLRIAVEGRARYVDAFDGPPTTTITLDSGLMVRLGGGRVTADSRMGEIGFAGDDELGRRLVRTLAFTI